MSKHFKSILFFTILFLICIFVSSFAYAAYVNLQEKQATSATLSQKANSILNVISPNISATYNLTSANSANYNCAEKQVSNKFENSHYYSVNAGDYTMKFDYETQNLLSITSNVSPVILSSLSKEAVKQTVQAMYENLNLPSDYSLVYAEKFSDALWEVDFAKMYGDIYNEYECVKIFYYPGENRIFALKVFNEPLVQENSISTYSESNYTEQDYIQKAVSELNLNTNNIHSTERAIVKANNYYNPDSTDTSLHEVFVINENLEINTRIIYIDVNTCEIVGGDYYLCLLRD